jgi:hypothetical protein
VTALTAARALAASVLALALAVPAARADDDDAVRLRGELRLGVATFDYAETYAGRTLDREQGVLPAIAAEGEVRWRRPFARLAFRLASGTVGYGGEVQAPSEPALDRVWARASTDALQVEGRLEVGALVDPDRRLALLAGLGVRRWRRTIHDTVAVSRDGIAYSVQGYSETYGWGELEAGARYAILDRVASTWDVEARIVRTLAPRLDVDFPGSPVTLELGAQLGWRAATTFRHALAPRWFFVASLWGEGYGFGASAVDPVLGILEPDSRTLRFGLELGVGARH